MSPPIPEPDVTPPLFDSFSSTPSVPELPSQEASLEDSTVQQDLPSEQPIETTYHLVLEGTIRGNTMHGHHHPGEFGVLASTQIQSHVKQVQLIYFF